MYSVHVAGENPAQGTFSALPEHKSVLECAFAKFTTVLRFVPLPIIGLMYNHS